MLISASLTKPQFKKLIETIRSLISQIEKHREEDLSEIENVDGLDNGRSDGVDDSPGAIFESLGISGIGDNTGDEEPGFEFLNMVESSGVG